VYVVAPLALIEKVCPMQIEPLLTVIVGLAFTVIDAIAVLEPKQPKELVPVTFIVVFVVGLSVLLPFE
jgi:hypothetical protein